MRSNSKSPLARAPRSENLAGIGDEVLSRVSDCLRSQVTPWFSRYMFSWPCKHSTDGSFTWKHIRYTWMGRKLGSVAIVLRVHMHGKFSRVALPPIFFFEKHGTTKMLTNTHAHSPLRTYTGTPYPYEHLRNTGSGIC